LGNADSARKDDYNSFLERNGIDELDGATAHGIDVNGWVGRPWHLDERFSFENWCVAQSIEFLKRRDPSQPFFLNLSFFAPHPPLTPPAFYYDRYMQMDLPAPTVGNWADEAPTTGPGGAAAAASRVKMDAAALKRCRAAYYGLINHVDDQVGRLFQALKRMSLWNETLVLFTSDHGEMLGDHHLFRKTFAYEASARVPFLMRTPKWMDCRPGVRVTEAVGLQDVCPTLLEAAGARIPDAVSGRSVLPFLRGEKPKWREFLHGEHSPCYRKEDGVQFLTDGAEKFVWYTQTGVEQFFDLREDRNETRNLINDPTRAARIDLWRKRMINQLKSRPESFSDGKRLIAGRPHENLIRR
jgi:arylsulfatase A-like enzyme